MTLEPVGDDDCAGSDTEGVAATTEHPDQQTSEVPINTPDIIQALFLVLMKFLYPLAVCWQEKTAV